MPNFLKVLLSGIRAKLALFTGSLITLTILVLSFTTVNQQTAILTESYEKQAAISKKYISALVVELNNIARNLIQIEEFRRQIAEQQKALENDAAMADAEMLEDEIEENAQSAGAVKHLVAGADGSSENTGATGSGHTQAGALSAAG